eukprot:41112-Prymnesium_polylepis.1
MRITQLASTPLAGLGTVAPIPYVIPGRARKQDPTSGHPHMNACKHYTASSAHTHAKLSHVDIDEDALAVIV